MRASVIINNFNYGHFMRNAIDSVLAQTYGDVEVIVVDDGSTDGSKEIISTYGEAIISIYQPNGGQASCFNAGFAASTGDVIFLLDADDFYMPGLVERVMQVWQPGVVKAHWQLTKTDASGKPSQHTLPDDALIEGDLRDQLIIGGPSQCGGPPNSPPTSGNAWSRSFLAEVLPMPEEPFRQGADNYLFVLAPLFGTIVKIDEPLGYYRVHGKNNTSKTTYLDQYFSRFEACADALSDTLKKQGIDKAPIFWPRDHWYHKVRQAMDDVRAVIPAGASFILIDENHWVTDHDFDGRQRIPFNDVGGSFNGTPANDDEAVFFLKRELSKGASFVVVPWSCAWYLTHYQGLKRYLDTHAARLLENDVVSIYELEPVALKHE